VSAHQTLLDLPSAQRDRPLDLLTCPLQGIQLIEASAGTGKTWNICGLYLRMLLETELTVAQILVVTFTNAATAELRERVRQRISDALAELTSPGSDPLLGSLLDQARDRAKLSDDQIAQRLQQALQGFDEAAIHTIHGFCQRALADTPFTAQVPLALELLHDDSDLRTQTVNDFWRQHVAGPTVDPALASYLLARGDTPHRWAQLLKRHNAKPMSRLIWPRDMDKASTGQSPLSHLQAAFETAAKAWQLGRADAIKVLTAGQTQLSKSQFKDGAVEATIKAWDSLLAQPRPPLTMASLPAKADLLGSARLTAATNKGKVTPTHAMFDAAQALLDAVSLAEASLRLQRLRLLRRLLDRATQALRDAKRERHVVAFDDMLFNLHERLNDAASAGLARALAMRFPAALIDEFQDTDPLQWAVFEKIYGQGRHPLFLVGDPKQAIYSFRHADLHTYLAARQRASQRHTLVQNQRASATLIDALNHLFGHNPRAFMQPGLHYRAVSAGAKPRALWADQTEPRAPMQVWTLPADARNGQSIAKADATQQAAQTCASEITRLLRAARQGLVTLNEHPLQAGQIAVLVRSHQQGSLMRQALAARGVGSVELSQASVFDSSDAADLERVLAAMITPNRPGLLKAALATRWLGRTANDIDQLAQDESAMLAATERFALAHQAWQQRGVGTMLRQWLHAEQIPQRLLTQDDGPRRLTNLLHLAEQLHQASTEHPAPENLLRWLQGQRQGARADDATQLRLGSDQNLVQIVTIHKSKGLEYPVVFCPFLWDGRLGASGDGVDGASGHDAEGLPVVDFGLGFDGEFDEEGYKAAARAEASAELLRLVYVALTRAVHRCYLVVGHYRARVGKSWSGNEAARSLLNWLVMGQGMSPADWLSAKKDLPDRAAIHRAWIALADKANQATPCMAVSELPAAMHDRLPANDASAKHLAALPPPARWAPAWRLGSYSALVHHATNDRAAADHDLRADSNDPDHPATSAWSLEADDILMFPRGPSAGECVHAALENAEFTDPSTWPMAIAHALGAHPADDSAVEPATLQAMLAHMLHDVMHTPLPLGTASPLTLATLAPGKRIAELEFHLDAPHMDDQSLNLALARWGYNMPRLAFASLRGYLKGYIDLVFEHQGRYFIADWKSNHLGNSPAHYRLENLTQAMGQQGYHLQHLIYGVALHRWLTQRLKGYQFEQHFGGAVYLFVRGVRPGSMDTKGQPTGVYFDRPAWATIHELSGLLSGKLPP
jgi:exodeoxyribonuclease V beta subunit